jgi:predicted lipoprotein with Yx(FWY)xxD motif
MTRTHHRRLCAAALLAAVAGCSRGAASSADSAGGAVIPNAGATDTGFGAPGRGIMVANSNRVGKYLADATGRALYMFAKDKKDSSACSGACVQEWMPYTEVQVTTASDSSVDRTKLGTVRRADGQSQVSYNGMPLYLYHNDKFAGDMKGAGKKDFGGDWYLVSPEGKKIDAKGIGSKVDTAMHRMGGKADTAMHRMGEMVDTAVHKVKSAVKKP